VAALVLLLGWTAACGDAGPRADSARDDRPVVVTTVSPITSIAAAVTGDLAQVVGVVPEGANSHTFEPPPSTAALLAEADVVLVNGLGLEDPVIDLAEANRSSEAGIVALADRTIDEGEWIYDSSFPRSGGVPNPHLWTNPPMVVRYSEIIRDTMIGLDPAHLDEYTAKQEAFAGQVDALDTAMRTAFATIPAADRRLLTYHDAYAYFAVEYGFEIIGAMEVSDFSEPTPGEVADLIVQVRDSGVPAIFGSEVFPSPVLAQIGAEADVRYVDVLRDDDLPDQPGDPDHSVIGLLRFDYATITAALGGDPTALDELDVTPAVADGATYPQ
jgi:ABC-type Zn uptake system ZnuABC Zn-binding protein ZnuA